MSLIQIDPLGWVPEEVTKQVLDGVVDLVALKAEKILDGKVSDAILKLKSDADFQNAFNEGIKRATDRFANEYAQQDEDLVAAIAGNRDFWYARSVRRELLAMIKHPGRWSDDDWETLTNHFSDVLPQRLNRERVDRAVAYFLRCLVEEVWHLPQLYPVYGLQLQRVTAEQATEMVRELRGMRGDVQKAMVDLVQGMAVQQKALIATTQPGILETPRVPNNVPQPDYGIFIGREKELAQVHTLLRPYPHSQHHIVVIDGIGGIGKSALALEVTHRYLRDYDRLPHDERFEVIVWTSAKSSFLTADGIVHREQITHTLSDIYKTIAVAFEREDVIHTNLEEQNELVTRLLTRQRTLLIVDNLETIDDERVNAFLRELPAPTKCVVTTRHRIDVAFPVRLTGMPSEDALALIARECEKKNVDLTEEQASLLYRRTGGVPLAIVWSIGQMGHGYETDAVLRRLGTPASDIARYCFKGSMNRIQGKPAHELLMALSLFTIGATREALGYVSGLPELDRDDGLVELEKLSLVNKHGDVYNMLPLTEEYAIGELDKEPELKQQLRDNFAGYYTSFKIKRADSARSSIQGIHLAIDLGDLYAWNDFIAGYFEANRRAIQRGVHISRIFVMSKYDACSDDGGKELHPEITAVLDKQLDIDVDVRILWIERIEEQNLRIPPDLIIFDRQEVHVHKQGQGGRYTEVDIVVDDPKQVKYWREEYVSLYQASFGYEAMLLNSGSGADIN